MKRNQGVTIVALVITIVVLLILAGISISLVLTNNGMISKAKGARNQYTESQTNDEKQLEETTDWIDEKVTGIKMIEGVPIPEDYYYVGGTKAKGIVISDEQEDEGAYKNATNGEVGKNLKGNQWVWVPVEEPSSLYTTVSDGIELSENLEIKTTKYTNSAIVKGITRGTPGNASNLREPDILTYPGYDDINCTKAGFSSLENMAENMVSDYDEMIRSLDEYKGFYIGRYELTANGEKKGASQTTLNGISWYTLYKNCTTLASGNKVKTRMIWGLQWDATCNWINGSGYSITNSITWGNYKDYNTGNNYETTNEKYEAGAGKPQNTGFSENWKANNIYDFAGNFQEYTQDAKNTNLRAFRGGYYGGAGSSYPALICGGYDPTSTNSGVGTRSTLYLIP